MTSAHPIQRFPAILILFLALMAGACTSHSGEPQRPSSVPKEAFWLGGPDGGVFVIVRKDPQDPPPVYRARIFYPHGETWYSGPLAASEGNRQPIDIANRGIFVGWDGEALILNDGRALRRPRSSR